MLIFCTMLNLCILMLFNTLVYLIRTEISAILIFHTHLHGGLNVKNYNNLCSAFMLFK